MKKTKKLPNFCSVDCDVFHLPFFSAEIGELFDEAAQTLPTPICIYAARELQNSLYFANKKNRPEAVKGNIPIGSEGSTAYLATCLARERPQLFLNHSPIVTLKRRKCRTIAVCDDCCGSGKRVADFILAMLQTDALKSWLSGGFIRFHVFAFAVSGDAEKRILKAVGGRRPSQYVQFHYCQNLASGAQLWSDEELKALSALCEKYGRRHRMPAYYWFGFGNQLCTLVFSHSCPNNTPGILWFRTSTWTPLFPGRAIPQALREAFTDEPSNYQQALVLQRVNANMIASNRLFVKGSQRDRDMLVVLAMIRFGCRDSKDMSRKGGIPLRRIKLAVANCKEFDLIDEKLQLTQGGREGLRLAEQENKMPLADQRPKRPYFPSQLRQRGGQ